MKKSEIKKLANDFLAKNPDETVVFATTDGQLFTGKNAANLHATTNPKKKKLEVLTFEGETVQVESTKATEKPQPPKPTNELSAEDSITKVETMSDRETLDAFEVLENNRKSSRKTVIEAIGKKRAELAADGGQKTDNLRKVDDGVQDLTASKKEARAAKTAAVETNQKEEE